MGIGDIIIIVALVVGAIILGIYYLNKLAYKKMDAQQTLIDRAKQSTTIFVINKKRAKISEVNLPKVVLDSMPKFYKLFKLRFVQAKIGPQIMTLICDKKVYNSIQVKKNVKVELAGIYIVKIIGQKSDEEIKTIKKEKKAKKKQDLKNKKDSK